MRQKLEKFWEPIVGAAALATVPFLIFEGRIDSGTLLIADMVIWSIFTVAFFSVLFVCESRAERWDWTKRSWLEVLIIVGSFPLSPYAFTSLRVLRVTQLLRFLRLGRLLAISYLLRWTRERFALSPVTFAGTVAILIALLGANALHVLEPDMAPNVGVGLWWAITTMTTVGYGDLAPITAEGRTVASFLMIFGVATMASFSGYLASFLVAEQDEVDQAALDARLDKMQLQLDRIEALLNPGSGRDPAPGGECQPHAAEAP